MSDTGKIAGGYRVIGPNTADHRQQVWYFPGLTEAKEFAMHIATQVDAEYHILRHVAVVRQEPLPARPVEFVWVEDEGPGA